MRLSGSDSFSYTYNQTRFNQLDKFQRQKEKMEVYGNLSYHKSAQCQFNEILRSEALKNKNKAF